MIKVRKSIARSILVSCLCVFCSIHSPSPAAGDAPQFPTFETHDINPEAGTGLAITAADIDGDEDLDIVGVSADDIYWYENPTWEKHLLSPTLKNSNVCVAAKDVTGDGLPELMVGADWQFNNTESGGDLYLVYHEGDPKQVWKNRHILSEPTLHRIRWGDLDGNGTEELIVAPLKGRKSTPPYFVDAPARILSLTPPQGPIKGEWKQTVIDETLHVVHNLWTQIGHKGKVTLLTASLEGITLFAGKSDGGWEKVRLTSGHPDPFPRSGSGEIKVGEFGEEIPLMGSIEPWHAHQAVVYTPLQKNTSDPAENWERHVVDDQIAGGHAVAFADFDGDGVDEFLVGFREKAGPKEIPGLNLYDLDFDSARSPSLTWTKHVIDEGGMATEDAVVADFNGDQRPDIAAFGRATHNIRLYLNKGGQ